MDVHSSVQSSLARSIRLNLVTVKLSVMVEMIDLADFGHADRFPLNSLEIGIRRRVLMMAITAK